MTKPDSAEFRSCGKYDCIESIGTVPPENYFAVYRAYFIQHRDFARVFILNDIRKLASVLGPEGYRELGQMADENNIGHIYLATISHDNGRPLHGKMIAAILSMCKVRITTRYFTTEKEAVAWLMVCHEKT